MPVVESGRYDTDRGAGNDKLTVFSQHSSALHVIECQLGKPWINAREHHGLIIPFCGESREWKRSHQACAGQFQEKAPVEVTDPQIGTARTGHWMRNRHLSPPS